MRLRAIVTAVLAASLTTPAWAQPGPTLLPNAPAAKTTASAQAASKGAAPLTRADVEAWLDGYMPYALQRGDVPGAVVVVVKGGQVLLEKGYGYADVAKKTPVDPETTMFRPGSVSKLFTWTALMQQVEQGKLDLDRDINDYLDFKIPPYHGRPITARNLMTHTLGFEEQIKNLMSTDPKGVPPLGKVLKDQIPARIFPPGQVPAYSNYGAALGGYLVERLSGQSFDDYIDQHIFKVLGMQHASFRQPLPDRFKPLMSSGYKLGSGPAQPYEMIDLGPAGSLAATGSDMAKFMIAQLQNGAYNGGQILKPETAKMMHGTPLTIISPNLHRMLLGFYEIDRNGHRVIGHGGDTEWFHSYLQLFPDDDIGLFVSLNSPGREGAAGPIRTALFNGFTDRYLPGSAASGIVDAATAKADAAAMAGTYDDSRRAETNFVSLLNLMGPITVAKDKDGHLIVPLAMGLNGQPEKFEEIAPFVWRQMDGKDRLAAKVVNGKVVMWSFDEVSPFMVFMPSPAYRNPAWLMPTLLAALGALALTAAFWPVLAIVRRRYGKPFGLEGLAAISYRTVRIGALASAALMATWFYTVITMLKTLAVSSAMDPWIMVLHLLSIVVFPLAAAAAIFNVVVVWRRRVGWGGAFARCWSVVIALSTLVLLWVALIHHLIGFGLHY
jgi:CubicO group peptidase (beta-lactamase class C family)